MSPCESCTDVDKQEDDHLAFGFDYRDSAG